MRQLNYRSDIAYLTDLFNTFNETNLQLQGDDLNLIKTKNIISHKTSYVQKKFRTNGIYKVSKSINGTKKLW